MSLTMASHIDMVCKSEMKLKMQLARYISVLQFPDRPIHNFEAGKSVARRS